MSGLLSYIPYPAWLRPEIIPGLPFRWYGLMYLVAFAVTYLLFMYQLRERAGGVRPPAAQREVALDMFFWAVIGLLAGGRLFDVIVYGPIGDYLKQPWLIVWPFRGGKLTGIAGMSYHGGVIGVSLAVTIFFKVKKLDALDWGDMLVSGIPLGYTFGRLGNFINGELYGRITQVPWGMIFPGAKPFEASQPGVKEFAASVGIPIPASGLVNLPRHPSQLYEGFFEGLVLWLILWFIVRKRRPYKGFSIALYMMGYGIIRFFIEYVRQPDDGLGPLRNGYPIILQKLDNYYAQFSWFNFTTGQILNVLLIAASVVLMLLFSRWSQRKAALPDAAPRPSGRKLRKKLR